MKRRTRFEAAIAKRKAVEQAEDAGQIVDSMEVRKDLLDKVYKGEITLEGAQAELKRIKSGAKKAGKITRSQAYSRG